MEKIKSISEAFSMQPRLLEVITQEFYDNQVKYNSYIIPTLCKEIKFEKIEIGTKCGDPVEELFYVGYNFDGQKIFQYIANTVNVHYLPNPSQP